MSDLVIEVRDEPLALGHYRCVATRAWWTAFIGAGVDACPYAYIAEQLLTEWVPQDSADDWMWDRRLTGERTWLAGNEEDARSLGLDAAPRWPTGQWRAPYGDYFAQESGRQRPSPLREGSWSHPTSEFLSSLPREPATLLARLEADTSWMGSSGAMTRARDALRTGRVPAELREAMYGALLLLPGAKVAAGEDADRRPGVALILDDEARRTEIIVDPDGGQFIGERETVISASHDLGLAPGTVITVTSVRVGAAPALGVWPKEVTAAWPAVTVSCQSGSRSNGVSP